MSKKFNPKRTKSKDSLTYSIRKLFDANISKELNHKEICSFLNVRENELRKQVYDILKYLSTSGFLTEKTHGTFCRNKDIKTIEGEIQITQRGAAFLLTGKRETDVFIAPQNTNKALNGDFVRVAILKEGKGRSEGCVTEILQRERTQFVGTISMHDKFAYFLPDNQKSGVKIYLPKEKLNGAKDQDKVITKITVWPKSAEFPFGEVVEILGKKNTNSTEMIGILLSQGIDYKFPQEVIAAAEVVTMELDPEEIKTRRDFRNITTFTIDPLDAKDFDDALSILHLENGNIEVGIHIADVSYYVREGSVLDKEALKRGNSVYLVDRVVPMLPEQISNLACSLRPNEDKFTFSAVFEMTLEGEVINEWFGKTVIHSDRRFTYEEAQEIIEGKEGDFREDILILDKIAKILRKYRLKSGALNIESEEIRFKLNEEGNPEGVYSKTSKDAHKLIEEFMLLANKQVAIYIHKRGQKKDVIPFVYRCHDKPDLAKIETFKMFINKFGHEIKFGKIEDIAKNINSLFEEIKGTNEYSLVQSMAIRSMAKASYETQNIGHFGLAFDYYAHFTSPIRRYADLLVHRILLEELTSQKHRYGNELAMMCKHISKMERKAVEAERESTKYFQSLFMKDHIGEEFEGTVSGVADFGLFIKLNENHCEGMIALQDIPGDRFYFDADNYCIVGARSKKQYNFGDSVKVQVVGVDVRKRQITLELL
jgi:ribonuclease R